MEDKDFMYNIFDYSDLGKKLKDIQKAIKNKYADAVEDVKKYDLNTQEGYENFITAAAELRKELEESNDFFFKDTILNVLDKSVEKVMNDHNNKVNEIVKKEVNRNANEHNNSTNKKPNGPSVWPSEMLTYRQRRNVWSLVDKFMDEMIMPYIDEATDKEQINDMASGLFEFAAWLLKVNE